MSVVRRSPSSTMIARFSRDLAHRPVDLRIARRDGREDDVATAACEMSFENPTTEVSGVRSSWLTFDRNVLLAAVAASAAARASTRSAVRSATRRSRALARSSSANSRAFSTPAAMRLPDRVQQRPVAGLDVATGQAVVDGEDPDRSGPW